MQELLFRAPTQVYCSPGSLNRLGPVLSRIGDRIMLVSEEPLNETPGLKKILEIAGRQGADLMHFSDLRKKSGNPAIERAVRLARAGKVQGIIGFGGSNALSSARMISAAVPHQGSMYDILDRVEEIKNPLPYIEIPGTCRHAFMLGPRFYASDDRHNKVRVSHIPGFFPCAAFIDPHVYSSLSEKELLSTLMDAFLAAIEGYFSGKATFFSDTLMLRSIGLIITLLPELIADIHDPDPLFKASQAGFFSAVAFTMTSPGAGTAASYVLSHRCGIPKAVISTILLPYVLEYGLRVNPEKVTRMGPILGENISGLSVVAAADRVVELIRSSIGIQKLPVRLSELGITRDQLSKGAEEMQELPFLSTLPSPMSVEDAYDFLKQAF